MKPRAKIVLTSISTLVLLSLRTAAWMNRVQTSWKIAEWYEQLLRYIHINLSGHIDRELIQSQQLRTWTAIQGGMLTFVTPVIYVSVIECTYSILSLRNLSLRNLSLRGLSLQHLLRRL